jgi:hypothetical protein
VKRYALFLTLVAACTPKPAHRYALSLDAGADAGVTVAYQSAYVLPDLAHAQAVLAAVDVAQGIPDGGVPGRDVGGGIHAPASQSVTLHYNAIIQSPSSGQWAVVPADSATIAAVAPNAVTLGVSAPVALDQTWYVATTDAAAGDDGGASLPDASSLDAGTDSGVVGIDAPAGDAHGAVMFVH